MSTLPHKASGPLDPNRQAIARAGAEATPAGGRRPARAALTYLATRAVVVLAVLLGVGLLLGRYATGNDVGEADGSVARWFVAERTPTLDDVSKWVSMISDTFVVIVLAALAVAVMRLAFKRWRESLLIIAALVGEVVLFLVTTAVIERERPAVPHLDEAPPTSSFPSGHVAAAVCLYGAFAIIAWSRMRPGALRGLLITVLAALPLAIGVSRMYRGMHYLTDVVAGLTLGCAWLVISARGVHRAVLRKDAGAGSARPQGRRL